MRWLVLLVALAFGCDDPAVGAKALDVLEHGFVAAQIRCLRDTPQYVSRYNAQRLLDGSCVVSDENARSKLCSRSEPCAATCEIDMGRIEGGIVIHNFSGAFDVETECEGFNLEALGVE